MGLLFIIDVCKPTGTDPIVHPFSYTSMGKAAAHLRVVTLNFDLTSGTALEQGLSILSVVAASARIFESKINSHNETSL